MSDVSKHDYKLIDEILWNEWDPVGVNDIPEARDEYQSYVSEIADLKAGGAGGIFKIAGAWHK